VCSQESQFYIIQLGALRHARESATIWDPACMMLIPHGICVYSRMQRELGATDAVV